VDSPLASPNPSPTQLDSIKAQLDLILLALEALIGLGSDAILATAKDLQLDTLLSDRVSLWRLRQSNPLRKGQGRKKLDVEEARALVLITCKLAENHHAKIRQAITLLEKLTTQNQPPHRAALLGDYIDSFSNTYQDRMEGDLDPNPDDLARLSLQLLIDLLFYSGQGGARRLWMALLDRAR
jgi:hypothetical protein